MAPAPDVTLEPAWRPDFEAIRSTLDASVADSTVRAYGVAADSWTRFCDVRRLAPWPGSTDDAASWLLAVLAWLQQQIDDGLVHSTLAQRLAGLKHAAARRSRVAHAILSTAPELRQFIAGARRRARAESPRQADAFTLEELVAVHRALARQHTVRSVRNRALIAVGIGSALRAQSLADLELADVSRSLLVDGRTIRQRWSKTDQTGNGRVVTIRRAANAEVDPVRALDAWTSVLGSIGYDAVRASTAPLFSHVRGATVQPDERISNAAETITDVVRAAAATAGLDDIRRFSSHSLRATFTTLSYAAGVPESQIAGTTGHKSLPVLRGYDRTAAEQFAQADYLGG